jgi:hypothetical protein
VDRASNILSEPATSLTGLLPRFLLTKTLYDVV